MGGIIFPELVKKRETSFPRSARRAMASTETGLGFLRVLFIEFPFLMRGFPKPDQVVVFACGIAAHFENQGVHSATHSADRAILFRNIRTRIQVGRTREDLLRSSKPMPRFGFARSFLLFFVSKSKRVG
ncbi:MAG: hypothetical protein DMG56_02850 [Acidobacteria bacterium]|nr:MAG: hypothetical protein DMG56_02850 [Acidobacteriota bacterium]